MFEEVPSLSPLLLFEVEESIERKFVELKNFSNLLNEKKLANVFMKWSDEGLFFKVELNRSFESEKDFVEIFIDTRNQKKNYVNKFCHHFFFSSKKKMELTRFRYPDDIHHLCETEDLKLEANSNILSIFIPAKALFGYLPNEFNKIGFSYKICTSLGLTQHFSMLSEECDIEKHPLVWSTLKLVKS